VTPGTRHPVVANRRRFAAQLPQSFHLPFASNDPPRRAASSWLEGIAQRDPEFFIPQDSPLVPPSRRNADLCAPRCFLRYNLQ